MKLQLDTTNKTVKLEENVKISSLIKILKSLLPEDWQDFTLMTQTTISYWNNPIVVQEYPKPWNYPWYGGVYCGTSMMENSAKATNELSMEYKLQNGTFNLEVGDA